MPTRSAIRWRRDDIKKLSNAVRRYNSLIARAANKNPGISEYLPQPVKTDILRDDILSRNDFNRVINRLNRSNLQNLQETVSYQNGLSITLYQKREIDIQKRIINQRRAHRAKELGQIVSPEKGTLGTLAEQNLRPRNPNLTTIPPERFASWFQKFVGEETDLRLSLIQKQYKENLLKSFDTVFGKDSMEADTLRRLVMNLSPEALTKAMHDNAFIYIRYIYSEEDKKEIFDTFYSEAIQYFQQFFTDEGYLIR